MVAFFESIFGNRKSSSKRGGNTALILTQYTLIASVVVLLAIGTTMVFSASSIEAIHLGAGIFSYVKKQVIFIVLGVIIAGVLASIPYNRYNSHKSIVLTIFLTFSLLLAVIIAGQSILGASRWLIFGPISLQPSEFVKIFVIIVTAWVTSNYRNNLLEDKDAHIYLIVGVAIPVMMILITQSDMGTTLIMFFGISSILILGYPHRSVLILVLAVAGVMFVVTVFGVGYRSSRLDAWLSPWSDPQGTGYQIIHSLYAIASGGLSGVGLGNSHEKYLYLPEAENDFIFAVIGEELGLIGAALVVVLFFVILWMGMRISAFALDDFGRLLAVGLAIMLVGQAFVNISCTLNLLPTTGKPLPFISAGGSSMVSSLAIIGILLSISRSYDENLPVQKRREQLRIIPGELAKSGISRRKSTQSDLKLVETKSKRLTSSGAKSKGTNSRTSNSVKPSSNTRTTRKTASQSLRNGRSGSRTSKNTRSSHIRGRK